MKSDKSQPLDYYQILGIENRSAPISEIKKKYFKLSVTYHPDKNKDADPELFKLIQKAWNCLSNPDYRAAYDESLLVDTKKKNKLKMGFEEYVDLQEKSADREKALIDFDASFNEIDKSRGFDRASYLKEIFEKKKMMEILSDEKNEEEIKNYKEQTTRKFSDIKLQRQQENDELFPEDIFKGRKIVGDQFNSEFNEYFDAWKEQNENDKLIKRDGILAFNETGSNNFSSISDISHDNLFDDDRKGNFINDTTKQVKNLDKFKSKGGASYYKGHNKNRDNVSQELEKFMRDRELDLQNIKYEDYIEDKSNIFTNKIGTIDFDDEDDDLSSVTLEFIRNNN
jgi:curved DNA-binding protein CbpA